MTIYIHIPKVKKTKLEPSEKKDTFVGYRVFHMEIDEEEQVAPPVVRQMTPPSTSSEEARVQRESTLRIQ
jgi:hypothetical protein